MAREFFYNSTTKKIILAFATMFDELTIKDDFDRIQGVPLHFAQKEKFLDDIQRNVVNSMDDTTIDIIYPRMGFEMTGMNFAPERHTNPMNQIDAKLADGSTITMYNRIPYDVTFDLFIGARKIEDGLKVLEQIIPYYSPGLTLTAIDKDDYDDETNITFVLNSVSLNIDYEGSLDTRRTILWTLNFTAKAYYYVDVKQSVLIKQTILEFRDKDLENLLAKYTSTVDPITANKTDPHDIIDVEEVFDIPEAP